MTEIRAQAVKYDARLDITQVGSSISWSWMEPAAEHDGQASYETFRRVWNSYYRGLEEEA